MISKVCSSTLLDRNHFMLQESHSESNNAKISKISKSKVLNQAVSISSAKLGRIMLIEMVIICYNSNDFSILISIVYFDLLIVYRYLIYQPNDSHVSWGNLFYISSFLFILSPKIGLIAYKFQGVNLYFDKIISYRRL